MFKLNRWWLLLIVLVVLGLALAACAPAPATPAEKVQLGLFVPVSGNTYEEARFRGAQEAAARLNAEVVNFSGEYDALQQINQIQDAIASENFDALLIHPIDSNAVVPVIEDALEAGLVVIGADSPIGPDPDSLEPYPEGVSAFIGRTGKATGEWLGQAVIRACEGTDPCEVAYLIGMQNLTIDQVRYANLEETIKDYPHIQIVAFQEALYRKDKGYEVMQNVFQANPGIDVVATSGDQMVLGALQAAEEVGLEGVKLIGNGASKEGCDALKTGQFFATIADIPYTQGQLLVETAVKALRGETFERSVDLNKVSPPLPEHGPVISKEDLSEYECQW